MAYEPVEGLEVQPDSEEPKPRGRVLGALAALALIIVLVLLLLLIPRCSRDEEAGNDSGDKQIVAVPDRPAEPGVVSVWIADGYSIEGVLADAGLEGSEASDVGGGRYVVLVARGSERDSVRALQSVDGVHDAGFVFTEDPADAGK